jgi:4-hydroxybenzoate polyprenyltransferase/phosphoserine phosphatase
MRTKLLQESDFTHPQVNKQAPDTGGIPQTDRRPSPIWKKPLCVDLDGTLVNTDMLWESVVNVVLRKPMTLPSLCASLWQGRAALKRRAALLAKVNVRNLPYNTELLTFLEREKASRRHLVLVTGTDELLATQVNDHLQIFHDVIGSNGILNLTGTNKRDRLVKLFGQQGFVYVGDSRQDIPVWQNAASGIVISSSNSWIRKLQGLGLPISAIQSSKGFSCSALVRSLRSHHWIKNALVFLPILLSGEFLNWHAWIAGLISFAALSLAASSTYIVNDLLDLESDRQHPIKRFRPIAAGTLALPVALAVAPALLGCGLWIATLLPPGSVALLLSYTGLSLLYSFHVKKIAILDVIFLAGLYCFRVFLGGAATHIPISKWTLLFGIFVFMSLAFLKRFTELKLRADDSPDDRRGYVAEDSRMVGTFGIASGYIGALVFTLYLNSPEIIMHYSRPALLWIGCPILVYWISHLWLIAERAQMTFDPVVFTSGDKTTYIVLLVVGSLIWLAK